MAEVREDIDHSDFRQDELVSLGRVLKEERERQGITCQAFADSLRMGKEQLEALENGDRDNLPEPVFICGMLRRVAQKLGLDPGPLVQQFQAQLRETKGAPAKRGSYERSGSADAPQGQQDDAQMGRWIRNAAIPLLLVGGNSDQRYCLSRQRSNRCLSRWQRVTTVQLWTWRLTSITTFQDPSPLIVHNRAGSPSAMGVER